MLKYDLEFKQNILKKQNIVASFFIYSLLTKLCDMKVRYETKNETMYMI